nr:MAG TPA: hypothetical protein [Bacteriophage sp.]
MYTAFFQGTNPVLELYIDKDICKVEAIEEIIVSNVHSVFSRH